MAGVSSTLTLASATAPPVASTTRSMIGPSVLHGPHHGAHRSTTTGSSDERRSTSSSNVASVLTLHSEPYWANLAVHNPDGSVTLALGETDPVYGMEVQLAATLHPGVAALEIGVRCYNGRPTRMPQMLWINTAIQTTPKTRFIYPMSRTVGHTTADIADWPLYNGIDYSWDRNNTHMLGVFGIDSYDNYQGAYQFDRDYGIFRYGDRRVVQI